MVARAMPEPLVAAEDCTGGQASVRYTPVHTLVIWLIFLRHVAPHQHHAAVELTPSVAASRERAAAWGKWQQEHWLKRPSRRIPGGNAELTDKLYLLPCLFLEREGVTLIRGCVVDVVLRVHHMLFCWALPHARGNSWHGLRGEKAVGGIQRGTC